jgi:hypothetical protein
MPSALTPTFNHNNNHMYPFVPKKQPQVTGSISTPWSTPSVSSCQAHQLPDIVSPHTHSASLLQELATAASSSSSTSRGRSSPL